MAGTEYWFVHHGGTVVLGFRVLEVQLGQVLGSGGPVGTGSGFWFVGPWCGHGNLGSGSLQVVVEKKVERCKGSVELLVHEQGESTRLKILDSVTAI